MICRVVFASSMMMIFVFLEHPRTTHTPLLLKIEFVIPEMPTDTEYGRVQVAMTCTQGVYNESFKVRTYFKTNDSNVDILSSALKV